MSVNHVYKVNMTSLIQAGTPRERRRRANFSRILDAAIGLVVEGGFDALSMARLAGELDYTAGALYRYYPSKDALIAAMTARVIRSFADVMDRAGALVPASAPLQRVLLYPFAYRDLAAAAPQRFGLLSMLLADPRLLVQDDAEAAPAMEAILLALAPLVGALEAARDAGSLRFPGPAADPALVAFGATHGVLQLRKQSRRAPGLFDLDALVRLSVRSLLLGWGADAAALDADLDTVTALGDLVAAAGGMT